MTNQTLYKLVFSPEVRHKLCDGTASLVRDKVSGLLLPVVHGESQIIGLPRLVPRRWRKLTHLC